MKQEETAQHTPGVDEQEKEGCGNCRFFITRYGSTDNWCGSCHRHSPSGVGVPHDDSPIWPSVQGSQWCGDYEKAAIAKATGNEVQA